MIDGVIAECTVRSFFWDVSIGFEFLPLHVFVDPEIVHVRGICESSEDVKTVIDCAGAMSPAHGGFGGSCGDIDGFPDKNKYLQYF